MNIFNILQIILDLFFRYLLWEVDFVWAYGPLFVLYGGLFAVILNIQKKPGPASFSLAVIWVLVFRSSSTYPWFSAFGWVISARAWAKLMHSLNGNIAGRLAKGLFVVLLIWGIYSPIAFGVEWVFKRYENQIVREKRLRTLTPMRAWLRRWAEVGYFGWALSPLIFFLVPVLWIVLTVGLTINLWVAQFLHWNKVRASLFKLKGTEVPKPSVFYSWTGHPLLAEDEIIASVGKPIEFVEDQGDESDSSTRAIHSPVQIRGFETTRLPYLKDDVVLPSRKPSPAPASQ